ncbi:uncharacterized protein [Lolium perenne]|uniref:uncharacterized protein n=1 Tax=Lolium perenne TaxID=4522 RepID=UPI0021EA8F3C|nr:uncharacterized protein LOC127316085 [Lolium perenne]
MPPRKRKAPAPPRRPPSRLEYQARLDGAWYSVRLVLQGGSLRVMYEEFPEEMDEWYDPGGADLASLRGVAALRARFRPVSRPLDDARCADLRPGQRLCVFCDMSELERKYYDAVLDSVKRAPHDTVDGEERCACRFKVRWTEGPRRGGWAEVGIADVTCVQDSSPVHDPVLTEFLDSVTKSFGSGDATAASQATGVTSAPGGGEGRPAPV